MIDDDILEELRAIRRLLERIAGPEPGSIEAEDAAFTKARATLKAKEAKHRPFWPAPR